MTEIASFATHLADGLIAVVRHFGLIPAASLPLPALARCRCCAPIIRLHH